MKSLSQLLALLLVVLGLGGLALFSIDRQTAPTIVSAVVVGALAGRFALLQESDIGVCVSGVLALALVVVLALLHDVVPAAIQMTLVGSLGGHLGLTLPDVPLEAPVVPTAPPTVVAPVGSVVRAGDTATLVANVRAAADASGPTLGG